MPRRQYGPVVQSVRAAAETRYGRVALPLLVLCEPAGEVELDVLRIEPVRCRVIGDCFAVATWHAAILATGLASGAGASKQVMAIRQIALRLGAQNPRVLC